MKLHPSVYLKIVGATPERPFCVQERLVFTIEFLGVGGPCDFSITSPSGYTMYRCLSCIWYVYIYTYDDPSKTYTPLAKCWLEDYFPLKWFLFRWHVHFRGCKHDSQINPHHPPARPYRIVRHAIDANLEVLILAYRQKRDFQDFGWKLINNKSTVKGCFNTPLEHTPKPLPTGYEGIPFMVDYGRRDPHKFTQLS